MMRFAVSLCRMMRFAVSLLLVAIVGVACGSEGSQATAELCVLADRVDAVYDGVEGERQLTAEANAAVESLIEEMKPLVPVELDATFRLRYWPNTSVSGLDTSGVSAQGAYDEWRAFRGSNC